MPDIKEKLVELISKTPVKTGFANSTFGKSFQPVLVEVIANYLISNGVTVQKWISVEEEKPKPETEVWILAQHGNRHIITTGMYEDGKQNTEDSQWFWHEHDFEYDEEHDYYIIPESWWEYKHYNGDDEYNHLIDDIVTHWMPLPEPPKGA